jgi:hypothetical protein
MGAEQEAAVEERIEEARRQNPRAFERRDARTGGLLPEPKKGEPGSRTAHDLDEK